MLLVKRITIILTWLLVAFIVLIGTAADLWNPGKLLAFLLIFIIPIRILFALIKGVHRPFRHGGPSLVVEHKETKAVFTIILAAEFVLWLWLVWMIFFLKNWNGNSKTVVIFSPHAHPTSSQNFDCDRFYALLIIPATWPDCRCRWRGIGFPKNVL